MTMLLPQITITAPIAATPGPVKKAIEQKADHLTIEAQFVYGSGGTTADAYVQTSLDNGLTWIDVANFHFTTASANKALNLSALTPVASFAPTDGSIANDTVKDGVFGDQWRVKYVTTGTYAGGTTLRVDVNGIRLTS